LKSVSSFCPSSLIHHKQIAICLSLGRSSSLRELPSESRRLVTCLPTNLPSDFPNPSWPNNENWLAQRTSLLKFASFFPYHVPLHQPKTPTPCCFPYLVAANGNLLRPFVCLKSGGPAYWPQVCPVRRVFTSMTARASRGPFSPNWGTNWLFITPPS